MSKPLKVTKKSVELNKPERVSRIRRDPVPVQQVAAEAERKLNWKSSEREIWIALIGIVAFALAIDIIAIAVATYWS